ncbi:MAG: T9SS type A sorting domain-containing protein, partial [Chitinophagaceae bacterium]
DIAGISLQRISVFPNPVENILRVQFQSFNNENVKMILSDLNGRALIEKKVNGKNSLTEIPVHHLISGIYQLKILSMEGIPINTYKIIKAN